MKNKMTPLTWKPLINKSWLLSCSLKRALAGLALAGMVGSANAATFIKADNTTALTNAASYTANSGVPGPADTIQVDNTLTAARSAALGDNLSVFAINQTGTPGVNSNAFVLTISATSGKTLTIGAGGITRSAANTSLILGCALSLGANQVWTIPGASSSQLQLTGPSFADNGFTLSVNGTGRIDLNNSPGATTYGANVTLNCSQVTVNSSIADIILGGANGFTNLLVNQGIVEGSSFPASNAAGTTSHFGTGSAGTITLGGNNTSGTLIYNGSTAATPKSFTFDARNSGGNTIKVSTAGQTLTLTNLLYANGTSQTADRNWNFGGAGNLTIAGVGAIKPSGHATFKIGVNKNDAGTLTLAGTNTYTGNTFVNGGTLALVGNGSISNTPIIYVAGGAKFDVSALASTFVLQSSQVISNNPASLATLAGNLNASSGAFAITFNPGTAPLTITNGTLTISASTVFNLASLNPRLSVGATYPLITAGAGGSVAGAVPSITLVGATGHLVISGGQLNLVIDSATLAGVEPLHWAASGAGTWDSANSGNTIWNDSTTPTALTTYFVNGDSVRFDEQYISGNQAVTLNSTVSPNSTLVSNATYNYTISGSGAIGGTGGLTKIGTGTLTLSNANTYTGGTVVSNGIIKMGNAAAFGSSNATVAVKSGAVLDVNGTTMASTTTYPVSLNGSGVSSGGALINGTGTAATFFGSIALGSDSTIKASSQSLTLGSSGSTVPITGSYVLTVGGGSLVDVFGNIQAASVTKVDAGQVRMESANSFAGGLTVKAGGAIAKNAAAYGTGTVYLLDTSGGNAATLNLGTSSTFNNALVVQAGSTGIAILDNFSSYSPTWSGSITLSNNLIIRGSSGQTLTVSGPISGASGLSTASYNTDCTIALTGTNTYSGATSVTIGKLALTGNGSISNTTSITVSGGATFDVTATTSGTFVLKSGQTLGNTGGTANLNGNFNASSGAISVSYDGATPVFAISGSLNLAAGTAFAVNPTAGVLALGTYNLIPSGVSGTAPTTVTMSRGAGYLVINGGTGLDLVITNTAGPTEPLHWAGTGTGLWQFGTPTNVWKDSSLTPVYSSYADSDDVQFDELFISANQVVTLNSTVTPPSILVSNSTYNYTISGTGTIGGSTPLTKTGSASLALQCGLNTTGSLTNNGGTVQLVSGSVRKVGGLAGSGGTVDVTTNRLTVNLTGQTQTYSGNVAGNYPGSVGAITAGFGLQVTNNGTLALNGAVSLSTDPANVPGFGTLSSIGALNTAELDLGGTTTLTNVTIRNNQTGIVRITGGNHTVSYTGSADKASFYGIILQDSSQCIVDGGTTAVQAVQIGFGGAPTASGPSFTINGGSLTVTSTNGVAIGANVSIATISSLNLNGGVLTTTRINDGGTNLTTSGNNIINFNGGKIVCAGTNVFPDGFGYNGANPIQQLVGTGGVVVDTAGYDNSIILPLQNNGTGGLTKLGLGALILATNNTYQGATVVSNGTLLVNGSLDPASTVTVHSGGTLGGSGTIGGAVTYNSGSHAVFALGTPLTLSSSLTIATSGTIPDVHLVLSNSVPVGTYTLATYSGGSGVFNSTPVIDSGSLAAGTAGTIVTSAGTVSLQVVASGPSGPGYITNSISGNTLTLTWPAGQGWLLQSNSVSLSNTGAWQTVTGATPPYPITLNPTKTNVFYRLKY